MKRLARLAKNAVVIALGAIGMLYLMFPTLGVFELIPDAIPFIGNLDEAGATLLVLNTLAYYGLDLGRLYGSPRQLAKGR
ncbi:MAG: DUF1232 domain-containing protein [Aggregatilineales bacterium]